MCPVQQNRREKIRAIPLTRREACPRLQEAQNSIVHELNNCSERFQQGSHFQHHWPWLQWSSVNFIYQTGFVLKKSKNFYELIDYGLVRNSHLCLISAMSWKNVKISGCVPWKSCKSNGLHQKGSLHPLQRNSITSLEFEMIHHYRLIHLPCMAG